MISSGQVAEGGFEPMAASETGRDKEFFPARTHDGAWDRRDESCVVYLAG